MATTASASQLQTFTVSDAVESTNGVSAIHPDGTLAVIYTTGPSPKSVKVAIYRPASTGTGADPLYSLAVRITLATPAGAVTPTAGASPSCSHPTICPIEDGFAYFYERRDTVLSPTTLTAGGLQIEMGKIKADGDGYTVYQSATAGKGYVLDNTVKAGHAGGAPTCAWVGRGNIVAVTFGHQLTYSLAADDAQRTYDVRAAYLDFTPNAKPTLLSGGNRMGGSASGEATDGGYAAGATQTYLVTAVDLDDDQDLVTFNSGGGLPVCGFDDRGDFMVAYEFRNGKAGNGAIALKIFKGPYRASGLDTAAIYSDTSTFAATAGSLARNPSVACRETAQVGAVLSSTAYLPSILLAFSDVSPVAATASVTKAYTVSFPSEGSVTPVATAVTVPANSNYDATADNQTMPVSVDSPFLSAVVIQEELVNTSGGDGYKFKIIHIDGGANSTVEVKHSQKIARPQRPNLKARTLRNGAKIAALVYDGQDASGTGAEQVYMELFQFA